MFQIGDLVKYHGANTLYYGNVGEVTDVYTLLGVDCYDVKFPPLGSKLLALIADDIVMYQPRLPIGAQQQLGAAPVTISEFDNLVFSEGQYESGVKVEVKCDCGGLKTYKTMDDSAHSDWCSIRRKHER